LGQATGEASGEQLSRWEAPGRLRSEAPGTLHARLPVLVRPADRVGRRPTSGRHAVRRRV